MIPLKDQAKELWLNAFKIDEFEFKKIIPNNIIL